MGSQERKGPFNGLKVIEIAGLAPAPFCGMILSDFGADVVKIDRPNGVVMDKLTRGKRSMDLDLKNQEGIDVLLKMIEKADVIIEPFRPGVAEKLGFGPDVVLIRNPKIIYARLTGWGQTGPMAQRAGHDINYIALSGALSTFARKGEKPMFPINLLGDFAAGGMLCALGISMALYERSRSGKGQVIDSAMMDGTAYLNAFIAGFYGQGLWNLERGTNLLDSGAHFYEIYKTKDGKYLSVGAIEPQFYSLLLKGMGLNKADLPHQNDKDQWPMMKTKFADIFATKTRDEWTAIFDKTDACVAPVIHLDELNSHEHNKARNLYIKNEEGIEMPSPAPRLSRTPGTAASTSATLLPGQHSTQVLKDYGFTAQEIKNLVDKQIVTTSNETIKSAL